MLRALLAFVVVGTMVPEVSAQGRASVGGQFALMREQGDVFGSGPSGGVTISLLQGQIGFSLVRSGALPRLQLLNELVIGESIRPRDKFILGLDETFRLHLRPDRHVGWYMEVGAGISSVARKVKNLDGSLQYMLHVGAGLRVNGGPGFVTVGYRFSHFSNNGTTPPNLGLNLHTVVAGYTLPLR